MREIENAMVVDAHWPEQPEQKVIGECFGCEDDITADQDYYEVQLIGEENVFVHQNDECCRQYVAEMSFCRGPEE